MKNKFSCFLTQKGRWLTAILFLLFSLGIGNAWGADPQLTIANPDQIEYSQGGVYVTGPVVANAKMGNKTNQKCFYVTSTQTTASLNIFSKLTNIKSISFDMVRNTGSSSLGNAVSLYVSKGDAYTIPTSTDFSAKRNNSDNVTSLENVQAIGNNVTNQVTNISVTFTSNVKAIEFRNVYSSGTYVRNLVVTYESGTLPDTYLKATMLTSANDAINMDVEPTGVENASITANTDVSNKAVISEKNYCKMDGTFTINLGKGKTFVAGDQIIVDVCAKALKKQVGITIDSKTINTYLANTIYSQLAYVVKTGDGIIGKQTATFERSSSDTYIHSVSVLRAPAATTYDITYKANGSGEADQDENASVVGANPFTRSGYRFVGWNTLANGSGDPYAVGDAVTEDLELYAQWAKEFTVSYNANGASGDAPTNSNKYIAGEKFDVAGAGTMVAPTNKAFGGWQYSTTTYAENDEFTMPAADVEFMAVWNDFYTVTYKANNGTEEADVVVNNPATIATCSFTAPATKTFKEWTTNADGSGTKYAPGAAVSTTLELYAQWKNAPQTLFEWTAANTNNIEADNTDLSNATYGTLTTGTSVAGRMFGSNILEKNKSGYKLGYNNVCIEIQGTSDFAEGDTVIITGVCGGDGARCFAVAPSTTTNAVTDTILTNTQEDKVNVKVYKVVITDTQAGTKMRIFRLAGSTMYCKSIKVVRPAGVKPTVSFSSNKSEMYTNETATLTFTSQNTNPVTYTIKKSGAVTTDASITGTTFEATVAGEYEIIATQASDGDFWAVEKSITITVNATIPVSAVTVAGAATGYIGNAITLTATAEYATQYRWYVDGTVQTGEEAATFAFTPTAVGPYSIVCEAKNQFNGDTWVASDAHSITGSHLYGEIIRATLTDGTHATVTGLVGGTADPNLTQSNKKMDNDKYFGVQLAAGAAFKEGDTVIIAMTTAGSNYPCLFEDKDRTNVLYLATEGSSALEYKFVLPAAATGITTVYISRHDNDYKWNPVVSYMSVVRPKAKKSTVESLTAVTVNSTAITAGELTTLLAGHEVEVATAYPGAPEVVFTKHTVITYVDDSNKAEDTPINVTAVLNGTKWEASTTINATPYTVKAAKLNSAKVYYYDGATKLGEETVAINGSPIHAGDYDDKNLTSFDGWYNNSDLALEHKIADIAALIVTADTNVYGKWTNQYATSINIEQWVLDNGKGEDNTNDLLSQLGSHYYASGITYIAGKNELDSLNDGKSARNEPYLGLKVKEAGKMLDFRLANGQTAKVKFGNVAATPKVSINGADYADMSITDGVYSYTATDNDYVSIKTASDGALVFKQIMINGDIQAVALPYLVTYDANGGTCATESAAGASVTLPAVTAPADYTFTGWYNGDTKVGNAGQPYVPTSNITLQAHFAPVEYAIAYDGNGATSGSMVAGAAGWGTMVTPATNAFEKTGHVFSGWEITKTSDGSATGITFSEGKFEMPKYDVTLVAQWEDNSKVAVVVETSAKYESLAAAIAAAEAGQTVQLIQDITQEEAILIDKNLTLDLNNKTFTVTNPSSEYSNRAIKVTAGTIVIENGTVDALSNETHNSGCWGSLRQEGGHLTCDNVTFKNYRSGGLGLKPVGGTLILNECTVLSEFGGGLELGNATVEVNNCTFTQTGTDAQKIYGACFGMGKMGTLTINGGTYTSDNYSFYIYTSGGTINVNSGTFAGDIKTEMNNTQYPSAVGTINISGGTFDGVGENPIVFTAVTANDHISISGGVFDAPIANQYCAEGYVPQDNGDGTYGVTPKDGVEIIGVVVTGNTEGTVSGLYKGTASIKLNNKKLDNGDYYIYVTLKEGYTFEENDVLIVDVNGKSDLSGGNKALEITTGVGNIDGAVWKSIAVDDYTTGENTISLAGIAAGQTSIGLKRSTNQNAKINGLRVLRPMNPVLKKVTVATVEGTPDNTNHVAIEVPASTADAALDAITYDWISNSDAWTAAHAPAVANTWAWGVENTVTLTDKDGDASEYYITVNKAAASSDATLSALTVNGQAVALADGVYAYDVELPYGTTAVPTVVATAHHAGAVATVDPCTLSGATITVVPESGAGDQQVYTLTFTVAAWEEIIIWDGSYMTAVATSPTADTELRWATTDFGSIGSYTTTCGEKSYNKYLPSGGASTGRYMTLTVPTGYVAKFYIVMATHSDTKERGMFIGSNLVKDPDATSVLELSNNDRDVAVAGMSEIVGAGTWYINPNNSIDFQEIRAYLRPGYARTSMLGNGVYGTVCVDHNVAFEDIYGATFYELVGQEPTYGKIAFDEITSGQLEAGKPYLFQANGDKLILFYGDETAATPDNSGALKGTYVDRTFYAGEADDIYFFRDHALWSAKETGVKILANRAWLDMSAITPATPNPAPGRRRVTMAINGKDTATDFENLEASEQPVKLMINGQIFILRGEKLYDATGRLVK